MISRMEIYLRPLCWTVRQTILSQMRIVQFLAQLTALAMDTAETESANVSKGLAETTAKLVVVRGLARERIVTVNVVARKSFFNAPAPLVGPAVIVQYRGAQTTVARMEYVYKSMANTVAIVVQVLVETIAVKQYALTSALVTGIALI